MENCNGDCSKKEHRKRSDCLQELQKKMIQVPDKGKQDLVQDMSVAISTMKFALNEDLRYWSYKNCKC